MYLHIASGLLFSQNQYSSSCGWSPCDWPHQLWLTGFYLTFFFLDYTLWPSVPRPGLTFAQSYIPDTVPQSQKYGLLPSGRSSGVLVLLSGSFSCSRWLANTNTNFLNLAKPFFTVFTTPILVVFHAICRSLWFPLSISSSLDIMCLPQLELPPWRESCPAHAPCARS